MEHSLKTSSPGRIEEIAYFRMAMRSFQLLADLTTRIFSPVPLPEILEGVIEFVKKAVKPDGCFLYLVQDGALVLRASGSAHGDVVSCLNLVTEKREMNAWIASIRSPISIGRDDPRFRCFDLAQNDRYQSLLMVPIVARDRVVGVLILQCDKGRPYNQDEIQFLMTAGLLLGAAVEIVILEDKNSQLTDQLETRKLVERAKGILQRDLKISEEDAYAALRRESSRKRKPMRDLAEAILFNDDFRRGLKSNGQS